MEHPGIEAHNLTTPTTPKKERAQIKNSSQADRWIQAKTRRPGKAANVKSNRRRPGYSQE